jgi:ATPase subunit of ABC transporter with duplicated ATPase domains
MTATLRARGLAAGHGSRTLFHDLALSVSPGDVLGLIGPNGCGKSTLMAILAGRMPPQAGTVELVPATANIGYLPQETTLVPGQTIAEHLARQTGVQAATAKLQAASEGLAQGTTDAADRYDLALHAYLSLGAPDLGSRLPEVAAQVGLDVPVAAAMSSLSGGQVARVNLMALLLSRFDVLALDEPTNDLDLAGLDLLERFVRGSRAGIIVVSHDREFLERVVTEVLDFDPALDRVTSYHGGFRAYLDERARARAAAQETYDDYVATREDLLDQARRARATAARGTKAAQRAYAANKVDKLTRDRMVDGATGGASSARRAQRAVQRLPEVVEPRREWQLRFEVAPAPRSGEVVLTADQAIIQRGRFQLGPVTLQVNRGDRVAITGPNGSGKTTLLGLLTATLAATAGTVRLGCGIQLGLMAQSRSEFAGAECALAVLQRHLDQPPGEVRTLLAKYGLGGAAALREGASLSAGERTRAAMALLAARGVNVLVLDEPTNHLDLAAIEQLESALAGYPATLLLVTHDRRLLAAVAPTRVLAVCAGSVRELPAPDLNQPPGNLELTGGAGATR